jgi:putative nucleotidyltransferase with HDIG domain
MELPHNRVEAVFYAALVHDIGKIPVPSSILSKPGRLSEAEFAIIKNHARFGAEILSAINFPWPIADIVLQHHEHVDGTGYPHGLKGDEISLEAKIVCVSDVVEAMSSFRPYRPALGIEEALEEIQKKRQIWFDSRVVDVCLHIFKETGGEFWKEITKSSHNV